MKETWVCRSWFKSAGAVAFLFYWSTMLSLEIVCNTRYTSHPNWLKIPKPGYPTCSLSIHLTMTCKLTDWAGVKLKVKCPKRCLGTMLTTVPTEKIQQTQLLAMMLLPKLYLGWRASTVKKRMMGIPTWAFPHGHSGILTLGIQLLLASHLAFDSLHTIPLPSQWYDKTRLKLKLISVNLWLILMFIWVKILWYWKQLITTKCLCCSCCF